MRYAKKRLLIKIKFITYALKIYHLYQAVAKKSILEAATSGQRICLIVLLSVRHPRSNVERDNCLELRGGSCNHVIRHYYICINVLNR